MLNECCLVLALPLFLVKTGQPKSQTMGLSQSKHPGSKARNSATTKTQHEAEAQSRGPLEEYQLKKRRPGCTGMFWRSDPTGKTKLVSNNDWPRDNAMMRGQVVEAKGEKWLLVAQVKQPGSSQWKQAPVGAAMPFEYNNHYFLG